MKRIIVIVSIIVLVCISAATAALAKTNYWALLIGISDYLYGDNDLPYAALSADYMRSALLSYPNWKDININILKNSQASYSGVCSGIDWLRDHSDSDDVCIFFFCGHGTQCNDGSPVDERDRIDEAICCYDIYASGGYIYNCITDDTLSSRISGVSYGKLFCIFDTCFSGGQICTLGQDDKQSMYL